jgi:hypothetical protein
MAELASGWGTTLWEHFHKRAKAQAPGLSVWWQRFAADKRLTPHRAGLASGAALDAAAVRRP